LGWIIIGGQMEEEESGSANLKPLLTATAQPIPILRLADLYDRHLDISNQSQRHFWFYFVKHPLCSSPTFYLLLQFISYSAIVELA
jgi:hypothetical protein